MVQVIELVKCEVFRFYYIILKQNRYQFSRRISFTLLLYVLQTQNLVHKVPVSFTDQLSSISLISIITACANYKPVSSYLWNFLCCLVGPVIFYENMFPTPCVKMLRLSSSQHNAPKLYNYITHHSCKHWRGRCSKCIRISTVKSLTSVSKIIFEFKCLWYKMCKLPYKAQLALKDQPHCSKV
jgi:hypothetical protein